MKCKSFTFLLYGINDKISSWKLIVERDNLNSFNFKTRYAFILMFLSNRRSMLCNIKVIWPVRALDHITSSACNVHSYVLLSFYLWFEKIAPKILLFASVKSFSRYNIFALKNQITFRTVNEYHWLSFFSNYCLEIKNSLIARRTKTIFLLLTALSFIVTCSICLLWHIFVSFSIYYYSLYIKTHMKENSIQNLIISNFCYYISYLECIYKNMLRYLM